MKTAPSLAETGAGPYFGKTVPDCPTSPAEIQNAWGSNAKPAAFQHPCGYPITHKLQPFPKMINSGQSISCHDCHPVLINTNRYCTAVGKSNKVSFRRQENPGRQSDTQAAKIPPCAAPVFPWMFTYLRIDKFIQPPIYNSKQVLYCRRDDKNYRVPAKLRTICYQVRFCEHIHIIFCPPLQ